MYYYQEGISQCKRFPGWGPEPKAVEFEEKNGALFYRKSG